MVELVKILVLQDESQSSSLWSAYIFFICWFHYRYTIILYKTHIMMIYNINLFMDVANVAYRIHNQLTTLLVSSLLPSEIKISLPAIAPTNISYTKHSLEFYSDDTLSPTIHKHHRHAGSLRYRIRSTSWPHPQSARARQKTCFPRNISQKISNGCLCQPAR